MHTNNILKADVLDIIFDNRNKLYGAYPLRKYYPERVKTALAAMFAVVAVFSLLSLLPSRNKPTDILTVMDGPRLVEAIPQEKPEGKPKIKSVVQNSNTQKLTDSFVTVKDNIKADSLNDPTDLTIGSFTNIKVTDGAPGDGPPEDGSEGGGIVELLPGKEAVLNPEAIIEKPDVQPGFPGGLKALTKFLERNLTNPVEMNGGEQVSVKIKFVVGYDGALKGFEIIQDGGTAFNNEVIRVLKKMPNWIPGKSNGRNVSVYHVIPVKFITNE